MAKATHSIALETTEDALWQFMKDSGEWATLIPGYLHHEFPTNEEMIWVFKGDFGFIQKAVKVQLKVTQLVENEKVAFELIGLSDNINGDGIFTMARVNDEVFQLTGTLNLEGGGFLAAVINPVLEKFVPETVTELVINMGNEVKQAAI